MTLPSDRYVSWSSLSFSPHSSTGGSSRRLHTRTAAAEQPRARQRKRGETGEKMTSRAAKRAGQRLTLLLALDGERLEVEEDAVIGPSGLHAPRAAEQAEAALVLLRPLGAGEHAAGRSRGAQITAAVWASSAATGRGQKTRTQCMQRITREPIRGPRGKNGRACFVIDRSAACSPRGTVVFLFIARPLFSRRCLPLLIALFSSNR